MKKRLFCLSACTCLLLACMPAARAQNPVVQTIYTADPAPLVYHDTLFLYTGHDEDRSTWFVMKDWHLYATTDMVNWTDRGSPLSLHTFAWAEKDAWAGHCVQRNGKFYFYAPVNARGAGMSIGVAVADRPAGPFRDLLGKPLLTGGWGYIDPCVFMDNDGQAYLYWGNPHLYYVKLNPDMQSYDTTVGIVRVPLTDAAFKWRILEAHHTFAWAGAINGAASHSIRNKADNAYDWYVSATDKATGQPVIAVGKGDKAIGPFRDVLGKPFVTAHCEGRNINPTVLTDEAGQRWLTWGTDQLWQVKLNPDGISYDSSYGIREVPASRQQWFAEKITATVNSTEKRVTTYEEGPWLYKRNRQYYLFYPAGGVPEHLAYSTATAPTGPWQYRDTVMDIIRQGGAFTNHPGVVDYKGKTYLFYHNGALPGGGGFNRSVCVDELHFAADGSVRRVTPSAGLQQATGKLNPYRRVEAETIAWEQGVETAGNDSTGIYVTDISNGDYIKVREVDFGSGAVSFEARVAPVAGGTIEIRTGSADGPLLGTCVVNRTGNPPAWTTASCRLTKATGVHDLFLVFRGSGNELFRFDWWKCTRK
jgi:arabinoxylan arabinofuranohydrolase